MEHVSLKPYANRENAKILSRFFKTGRGEYGEGDRFLGVTVPVVRSVARENGNLPRTEITRLLRSEFHEERLLALLLLISQFENGTEAEQKDTVGFYLKNTRYVNNWDLVDLSAYKILGEYLVGRPRKILYDLTKSKNLWERRIAIISTFAFIRNGEHEDTFGVARLLLNDEHDLMHKAVGWMLREVGKWCGLKVEKVFLDEHRKKMPRTALRYAIERFSEPERKRYLKKT